MDEEVKANAEKFRAGLGPAVSANITLITAREAQKLDEAYARLTSLQAWRSFVLESCISPASLGFFSEAQNDALTSSVLISTGLWRSSMKSLRGVVENIIQCMFYKDHPVELRLWSEGKHRPQFKELFAYLESHPDIIKLPENLNPVADLKSHYSHLSNIVHASGEEFRMTTEANMPLLWKTGVAESGKWASTHKKVLRDVNLLLIPFFKEKLLGAQNAGLKQALALCIPVARDSQIKTVHGFKIPR